MWRIRIRGLEGFPEKLLKGFKNKKQKTERPGQGGRSREPGERYGALQAAKDVGLFPKAKGSQWKVFHGGVTGGNPRSAEPSQCTGGRPRRKPVAGPRQLSLEPRGDWDRATAGELERSEWI